MKILFQNALLGTEGMPQRLSTPIALAEDRSGVYVCACMHIGIDTVFHDFNAY